MSFKRKGLGALIAAGASLPVSKAFADKTLPSSQRKQPRFFVRNGKSVQNPFYKKRKRREKKIKAVGAAGSAYLGQRYVPGALQEFSTAMGNREYNKGMQSIDTALDAIGKVKQEALNRTQSGGPFASRYNRQFLEASRMEKELKLVKSNISKEGLIKNRNTQTLGLRGTGIGKTVRDIIGTNSTMLGGLRSPTTSKSIQQTVMSNLKRIR